MTLHFIACIFPCIHYFVTRWHYIMVVYHPIPKQSSSKYLRIIRFGQRKEEGIQMAYLKHKRGMTFFSAPKWGHFLKPRKFSTGNEFIKKKGLRYLGQANDFDFEKVKVFSVFGIHSASSLYALRIGSRETKNMREGKLGVSCNQLFFRADFWD